MSEQMRNGPALGTAPDSARDKTSYIPTNTPMDSSTNNNTDLSSGLSPDCSSDCSPDAFSGDCSPGGFPDGSGASAGQAITLEDTGSLTANPMQQTMSKHMDHPRLHLIPLTNRKKSLANLFSGRLLLAAGLDWTKAEPGLSLKEQARDMHQDGFQSSLKGSLPTPAGPAEPAEPADPAPDHGLVIEERAGFARLYSSHALSKAAAGNADTMPAQPQGSICDAFCTVCSLAALRLQSLRHGIEIWPLPANTLSQGSLSQGSLSQGDLSNGALPEGTFTEVTLTPSSLPEDSVLSTLPASQDSGSGTSPSETFQPDTSQSGPSQPGTVYWVFAARLGRLSARADQCFTSLDEALSLARRLQESLDLQEARVLDDADVREELNKLAQAGSDVISKCKLRPLSLLSCQLLHNRSLRRGLAALLFGGLVISACCLLSDPIAQRLSPDSPKLAQKQKQDAKAEAVAAVLRHPERFFPSAWMTAPSPAASVLSSVPEMLKTPLAANGWTLEEVSSANGTLTATWKAARASSLLLPPEGAERLTGDATKARSVTKTPATGAYIRQWQELAGKDEVQAVLSELAARFGLKLQLSWKPVRTIKKDNAVVSCPWAAGSLVLSQAPGTLFFDFANLTECLKEQRLAQSLVLSGITWNKKQWIMQGEVYAKP